MGQRHLSILEAGCLALALALALSSGCQQQPHSSRNLKSLADTYVEVWNNGNVKDLDGIIDPWQPYFIKPSNNVLLPAANGFREWVAALASVGIKTLVMGGCTLNSCLRVSAVETWNYFPGKDLAVIADLSLCGARTSNYLNSDLFQGMSPVESAIRQMSAAGVLVADSVEWVGK